MTHGEMEQRVARLTAGIAQSGVAADGTIVTVWPRDRKSGLIEITAHAPGKERTLLTQLEDPVDALEFAEQEVLQREPKCPTHGLDLHDGCARCDQAVDGFTNSVVATLDALSCESADIAQDATLGLEQQPEPALAWSRATPLAARS